MRMKGAVKKKLKMNKNKGEESHFGLIAAQSGLKAVVPSECSLCLSV